MSLHFIQIAAGLALLLFGGDALVRGAVAIAGRLGISPLLIGLTLVGFGTSTPELITSVHAALIGSPGIAVGNVIGSNTSNILLILGVAAVIRPMRTSPAALRRDGGVVALATIACVAIVLLGHLERWLGTIMVVSLAAYIVLTYSLERTAENASAAMHEAEASAAAPLPQKFWLAALLAVGGLAMIMFGAHVLVSGAIELARSAAISETMIGVTIVALGTSLPELVTSIVASLRGQADVAFGNVLGSNTFNLLGILGITALVQPIMVPPEIIRLDVWVMAAATALLLAFAVTGWRLSRGEGLVFLAAYVCYVTYLTASQFS